MSAGDTPPREVVRLRRAVLLLGAAGIFFAVSLIAHLAQGGGVRAIDVALLLWGLLFVIYVRRWRAAVARARDNGTGQL